MSEKARDGSLSDRSISSQLPYESIADSSYDDSSLLQSFDDSVFEPDTEENMKLVIAESGKRFELGSGLANVKTDLLTMNPVSKNRFCRLYHIKDN